VNDAAESVQEEVLESRPGKVDVDKVVRADTLALAAVTRLQNALGLLQLNSLAEIRAIQVVQRARKSKRRARSIPYITLTEASAQIDVANRDCH
jgi:hypothetical protein